MSNSVFGIGITGLAAAQAALVTSGHNIANAATPGFHRQRVELQNATPQPTGDGFLGSGVDIVTISRVYSAFLDNQVTQAQGRLAELETYHDQISEIDRLLADPNSGLTPAIEEFFRAVHDVGASPASVASRQAMLSGAETLVGRFHSLDGRFGEMQEANNRQIRDMVTSINSLSTQVANLNQSILAAKANGAQTHSANDLMDQRDAVITELNQLVGVSTAVQGDGSVNVMIGNGQNVVVGQQALTLAAVPSIENPNRMEVAYNSGGVASVITDNLTGGKLGGVLAFRSESLDPAANSLGRIATAFAGTFNAQHLLGQDLNGNAGVNFFNTLTPTIVAKTTNAGNGVLNAAIADPGSLTTSDYRVGYNAGTYTVTRLNDGVQSSFATLPQTVDGVSFNLASGTPSNGDSFLVQPTRYGARDVTVALKDGARIAAAAPMRTLSGAANTGTAAISSGSVNPPAPTDVNLRQTVTITFTSATTFDVTGTGTGNPTGVAYSSGSPITYNGWTAQISGVARTGDTFTVQANLGGISDNRNVQLLADLQTKNTIGGGTATYQSAYSQTVSAIGAKTREVGVTANAQASLVKQTEEAQQSLSGVNLDEEAANLIRYQQAYQASGKMIEIAARLFDTLLALGR
jgi:flagellar hook-associated protein 1 FlgK